MRARLVWASFLFAPSLSLAGGGAGLPRPPADPARRAQVEALVRDLGDPDHAVREAAGRRLEGIGADAAWALAAALESDDSEVRQGAKRLLDAIGWVSPSDQREIDRLVGLLKTTRDREAASRAFNALQGMGKGALDRLKGLFPDEGRLELAVRLEETTFTSGSPLEMKFALKNTGSDLLWINPDMVQFFPRWEGEPDDAPLDPRMMGSFLRQQLAKEMNALAGGKPREPVSFDLLCVAPGEALEWSVTVPGSSFSRPGRFRLIARYETAGIPCQDDRAAPGATPLRAEASAPPAFMLPPLDGTTGGLRMELVPTNPEAASGDPFRFEVVLKGEKGAGIPLDLPPGRVLGNPFWAALVAEDGAVVAMKTHPPREKTAPPHLLGKGETLRLEGELPQAAPPGRYRLVAGYAGRSLTDGFGRLFGMEGDPAKGWTGESVSPSVPVVVK